MVCHGLYTSMKHLSDTEEEDGDNMSLGTVISDDTMEHAVALMKYGMEHKFALMPPPIDPNTLADDEEAEPSEASTGEENPSLTEGRYASRVHSVLTYGLEVIDSSKVAQRKLMPPLKNPPANPDHPNKAGNKYPVEAARKFLCVLSNAGLGEMVEKAKGRRSIHQFHKRKYTDLSADALDIVKKLKISETQYKFTRE